jgi:hypothetical protein
MKKSEFLKGRTAFWEGKGWYAGRGGVIPSASQRAESDVEAAEAAGVVWDPEEEPLPATVFLCNEDSPLNDSAAVQDGGSMSGGYYFWVIRGHRRGGDYSRRVAQEAVRRWNAWPELLALVDCLGDDGSPKRSLSMEDKVRRMKLLGILGKEGE